MVISVFFDHWQKNSFPTKAKKKKNKLGLLEEEEKQVEQDNHKQKKNVLRRASFSEI